MAACRRALAMSENQRETQHICLYEIGKDDSPVSNTVDIYFSLTYNSCWVGFSKVFDDGHRKK